MNQKTWIAAIALAISGTLAGCSGSVGVGYRAYDPYYGDYHVWSDAEVPYYNAWVVETHRPHVDYNRLHRGDREAYWRWRHDHQHDRDRR
jgi:hypothetical protein